MKEEQKVEKRCKKKCEKEERRVRNNRKKWNRLRREEGHERKRTVMKRRKEELDVKKIKWCSWKRREERPKEKEVIVQEWTGVTIKQMRKG